MNDLTMLPFEADKLREECGVFGVFGHPDAAPLTVLGLHALPHRGQEAGGTVSFDGEAFHAERRTGLIGDTFTDHAVVGRLHGDRAIGHVRYSTHGGAGERNIQPLFAEFSGGGFAVAHNGNLTNALTLQAELQRRGSIFQSTSDTEVILHLIATSGRSNLIDRIVDALRRVEGAWSLVCLSTKKMIGCRDPLGVRPLVLGDLDGARSRVRDLRPTLSARATCATSSPARWSSSRRKASKASSPSPARSRASASSSMSTSAADSVVEGRGVYDTQAHRRRAAREHRPPPTGRSVPDSGTPAAIGFAEAAGLPFDLASSATTTSGAPSSSRRTPSAMGVR